MSLWSSVYQTMFGDWSIIDVGSSYSMCVLARLPPSIFTPHVNSLYTTMNEVLVDKTPRAKVNNILLIFIHSTTLIHHTITSTNSQPYILHRMPIPLSKQHVGNTVQRAAVSSVAGLRHFLRCTKATTSTILSD